MPDTETTQKPINTVRCRMNLEQGKDPISAKWNVSLDKWDIGEKTKYRWVTNDKVAQSDWFYDISDALAWIKEHDIRVATNYHG
jgi:hypothetical protein